MFIIDDLKRIHKIHKLIKGQQTGSPEDLASLICVSRRELYYIIEVLKNMGAEINYSRAKQSFCYTNAFDIGENGGYPPTKNGDIRSLLCA